MKSFPSSPDYIRAITKPQECFKDQELKNYIPEATPRKKRITPWFSGQFAVIFKLKHPSENRYKAVRCFTYEPNELQYRYRLISEHIKQTNLPYFVDFEFIDEGIKVDEKWYPIIKMDWVDGLPLTTYIARNINTPFFSSHLAELRKKIKSLQEELASVRIAHGDLQHGNILINEFTGNFKLVDYDGIYVPGLNGYTSNELGHTNYQHPQRSKEHFGDYLDEFSFDVLLLSLDVLAKKPNLWRKDDNCLILKQEDFVSPRGSEIFREILSIRDPEITANAEQLIKRCENAPYGRGVSSINRSYKEDFKEGSQSANYDFKVLKMFLLSTIPLIILFVFSLQILTPPKQPTSSPNNKEHSTILDKR